MKWKCNAFLASAIIVLMIVFLVFDITRHVDSHFKILLITIESLVLLIASGTLWVTLVRYKKIKSDFAYTQAINMDLVAANQNLKSENNMRMVDIQQRIDIAINQWELTDAEKSIVLLVLKGFSNKEIAEARKTSENTVRQQTASIYKKSNLHTRTELSAHFIQNLLGS